MFCPRCGKENPDNAKLCQSCSCVLPNISGIASAPTVKTSGLAIASLVLGILSFFTLFLTAIPAIILGIVALVRISKSSGQLKGNDLAITGIVIPVAPFALGALILGFMILTSSWTHHTPAHVICGSKLSNLGKALLIYANDYDDKFPTPSKWCDLLIENGEVTHDTFRCKSVRKGPCNYAMNKNVERKKIADFIPDMVLLFETYPGWNQVGGPEILTTDNHKGKGCNVLFMDTHVEFIKTADLHRLKWTAE